MLAFLKTRKQVRDQAATLYLSLMEQARSDVFYKDLGVPDTIDGRFDMISLYVGLVVVRLRDEQAAFTKALVSYMFDDMDQALRELGVGDPGIWRRIKAMIKGFHGRIKAYDQALGQGNEALEQVVKRNIYGTCEDVCEKSLHEMSIHIQAVVDSLSETNAAEIMEARLDLPQIG